MKAFDVRIFSSSTNDLELLKLLLERMRFSFQIKVLESEKKIPSVMDLCGSWKSDESVEDLIKRIFSARQDSKREIQL